jgi:fructoselysine-6-P-deglycase FrlB-like protein
MMSYTSQELATQAETWTEAAALVARSTEALPRTGERVAMVGCGSAWNIGQVFAAAREAGGHGETDAFTATEVRTRRPYDRMIFVSRTGTTTETLEALRAVPKGVRTTAITANPESPIAEAADEVISMAFADERSVVQTRFVTSVLVLLRAHLGEDPWPLIAKVGDALAAPLPTGALEASQFTFLGRGSVIGLAHEAALKLRESAQAWVESYSAMEYRHGPISVSDERSLVWCLDEPPSHLADEVRATGARFVNEPTDPLLEMVRVHRLAVALAEQRGLDPDLPRRLHHSVILD